MKRIFISLFFFAFMWTAARADAYPELLFVRWPANPDAVWYSFRIGNQGCTMKGVAACDTAFRTERNAPADL